jgi:pimeloyl-ACP methyl ester carboxylesterase
MATRDLPILGHRVRVSVDAAGPERPAFVMIHGIGMSGRYYGRLARRLRQRAGTVTVDLPGFGSSSNPAEALSLEAQAEVVTGVMERLGLTRVVLVGHSLGCQVVLKTALGNDRVAGMVLIGPTADRDARTIRQQFLRLVRDTLREPPAYNVQVLADYLRCSFRCYLRTLRPMVADHPERDLLAVGCPVAIVRGSDDPIAPATWTAELASFKPGTMVHEVAGGHHGAHFNAAEEVAALCEKLL